MKKIGIIGAGISGLYIANLFKKNPKYQVSIFDKKNSLNGIVFIDFKVCILILLSKLNSNGSESPIGDAVAILPTKVPTFRI